MGDLFDKLAKDAAATDVPRRDVFRRIGGTLLGLVLASVGLSADKDKDKKDKEDRDKKDKEDRDKKDKEDRDKKDKKKKKHRPKDECTDICTICCDNLYFPPRGRDHAMCIRDCVDGLGTCGPIVCPHDDDDDCSN